jgi:hypothetical protein
MSKLNQCHKDLINKLLADLETQNVSSQIPTSTNTNNNIATNTNDHNPLNLCVIKSSRENIPDRPSDDLICEEVVENEAINLEENDSSNIDNTINQINSELTIESDGNIYVFTPVVDDEELNNDGKLPNS